MEKGKALFVTVLIAAMLSAIDSFLYVLSSSGFVVLTGAFVIYGMLRWAWDFYRWLCRSSEEPTQHESEAAAIQSDGCEISGTNRKPKGQNRANRGGAIMDALNEDI